MAQNRQRGNLKPQEGDDEAKTLLEYLSTFSLSRGFTLTQGHLSNSFSCVKTIFKDERMDGVKRIFYGAFQFCFCEIPSTFDLVLMET